MESSLVTFMDDLLDFASDIGEEDEEDDVVPGRRKPLAFSLKPKPAAAAAAAAAAASGLSAFHTDDSCRLLPDYAEEELEWLSNSDAFPAVETFVDILSEQQPPSVSKQNSPVSVLENSSSSSHSDNNSKASIHSSVLMSCCGSLKVPGKARSKRRRKHVSGHQLWFKQPTTRSAKQVLPPTPATATTAASASAIGRKCLHCGAEKTPQWRAGPLGPKTLCNACGVRFKSGRLVPEYRPASSPSFSPDLHSNSHRKVMEMRRQKQFGMLVNPMDKG